MKNDHNVNDATKEALSLCITIAGTKCQKLNTLSIPLNSNLPGPIQQCLHDWNETSLLSYPPATAWKCNANTADFMTFEYYYNMLLKTHLSTLIRSGKQPNFKPLKHVVYLTSRLTSDLYVGMSSANISDTKRLIDTLFPLILDACSENISDVVALTLQPIIQSDEIFLLRIYGHVLQCTFGVFVGAPNYQQKVFSKNLMQTIIEFLDKVTLIFIDFFANIKSQHRNICYLHCTTST